MNRLSMFGSLFKTALQLKFRMLYSESDLASRLSKSIQDNDTMFFDFLVEIGVKPNFQDLENAIQAKSSKIASTIISLGIKPTAEQIKSIEEFIEESDFHKLLNSGIKFGPTALARLCNKKTSSDLVMYPFMFDISTNDLNELIKNHHSQAAYTAFMFGTKPNQESLDLSTRLEDGIIFRSILKKVNTFEVKRSHILYAIEKGSTDNFLQLVKMGAILDENHLLHAIRNNRADLFKIFYDMGIKISPNNYSKVSDIDFFPFAVIAPEETIELLSYIDTRLIPPMAKKLLVIGHYYQANLFYDNIENVTDQLDIVGTLTEGLIINLRNSIEPNKMGAMVNLISRTGVHVPKKYKNLVGNIHDTIDQNNFDFVYGLMHKLAEHYVALDKNKLLKEVGSDAVSLNLIEQIFSLNNSIIDKFLAAEKLKELHPHITQLRKINTPFDTIYLTIGKALEQIDHDFALEVFTLNGYIPSLQTEDIRGYRGLRAFYSESELESAFKYGHRAFGATKFSKNLSYHVKAPHNPISSIETIWGLGGTYISLEPNHAGTFARGYAKSFGVRSLLIEVNIPSGNAFIQGFNTMEYEIVPAGVKGDEIVAIYELGDDDKVARVFKNPYIDAAPRYKVGDDITYDAKAVETYERLYKATETYRDYDHFLETYVYQPERLDQFYENRPELPNQVSVSPKALSEVRLDQDVLAFQCLDDRFTQFVMHSSLPEVKELQPAPLPIMPDSGTPHLPTTPETSSALTVPHSQESRAVSTYFDIGIPSIETVSNAVTTINAGRCIVHGAKQFAEYFMSTTREIFSPKVEHKYVRQLQENANEVLKYIKKVGKDLDRKDPQNIEAFTEEAQKIERKIDGKSSFTSKQMKEIIDDLIELYKDAKKVAKESGSKASRHLTSAQNLENLAREIYTSPSR